MNEQMSGKLDETLRKVCQRKCLYTGEWVCNSGDSLMRNTAINLRVTMLTLIVMSGIVFSGCNQSGSDPQATTAGNEVTTPAITDDYTFVNFESGHVRPLALSADGTRLFATNTPNDTLDILSVTADGLDVEYSVPVGIDPVAVALFRDEQAWVVNHLSDSISVVDVTAKPPRVIDTLLVGDEPRDIVFAGADNALAFVMNCLPHR